MSQAVAIASDKPKWEIDQKTIFVTIAVMMSTFMVVLDTSIANVALPHIAGSFSATSDEAIWVLTSYMISEGIILPTTAWFSTLMGRKTFLMTCVTVFTCASVLCGMSQSLDMMIFARVIQGLGGGALMPLSQSILFETYPREKHGIAMSIFGFGVVLAPVIGPTLGGWITDNYSWHWIFFINVPVGLIALILSYIFLEDPDYLKKKTIEKIDYVGFSALVIWLVTMQVVLDNGQKNDWFAASWICWTSALSFTAMVTFFAWELKYKNSIIDLSVFKDKNYAIGTTLSCLVQAILYSTLAILPLFLQNLMGYSAYHSGMAISPRGVATLLSIIFSGILIGKVDIRGLIIFGFIMLGTSSFMFGNSNLQMSIANIVIPNLVCGVALGFIFIPLATVSFSTLKPAQIPNATGLQNLAKSVGGSFGTALVVTLLTRGAQTHQTFMVSHLNNFNPVFHERVQATTSSLAMHMNHIVASHKANAMIYNSLLQQANLWSYIDNFRFYGTLCFLMIPLVLFIKPPTKGSKENVSIH